MADNVTVDNGDLTDYPVASDKVTYSSDADQNVQLIRPVHVDGAEGAKTVIDVTDEDGLIVHGLVDIRDSGGNNIYTDLTGNGGLMIAGDEHHDSPDLDTNPVKIGGKANTAPPANVADGDRVNASFALNGSQRVTLVDSLGGEAFVTAGNKLTVAYDIDENPFVVEGARGHDILDLGSPPVKTGGYASGTAPTDVGNGDVVNAWHLRNGAQAVNLTAAGALIPGNATDGLLVNLGANNDVTPKAGAQVSTDATLNALNEAVTMSTAGAKGVVFVITDHNSPVGEAIIEASPDDGATWSSIYSLTGDQQGQEFTDAFDLAGAKGYEGAYFYVPQPANMDGMWHTQVRFRISAYTSGSVDIRGIALTEVAWNLDGQPVTRLAGFNNNALDIQQDVFPRASVNTYLMTGGIASAAAPTNVTDGRGVGQWYLRNGAAATVVTAAGALIGGDATNGLDVDVTRVGGNVTVIGAAADGAAVSGNPVRIAGKDGSGNTQDIATDTSGELQVDVLTLPNVAQATASNLNAQVVGPTAVSAGVSGNPLQLAGMAIDMDDTAPPNSTDAESDVTRLGMDRDGTQFVHPHGPRIWSYHLDTSTAQTDATVHSAPASGLSLYVTDIVFSSGAATAINLFFEEGSTKVLGPYYLEAIAGRGMAVHFTTPKKITAATALTLTTSASIAHAVDVTGFTAAG